MSEPSLELAGTSSYCPAREQQKAQNFLKEVVAFRRVAAGERESLAEVADVLCAEFGYPGGAAQEAQPEPDDLRSQLFAAQLTPEEEALVGAARCSLARLATALQSTHPKVISETTYRALLDGMEFVMRSEVATGNRLAAVMPSLVFLIALPMLEQDRALELARRTSALLE
jgi:hypothetical protein